MDMNGSFQKPWRSQANTEKKVWSNLAANFPPKAESFVKKDEKGRIINLGTNQVRFLQVDQRS